MSTDQPPFFSSSEIIMAKNYRTPTVDALGAADVITRGLPIGALNEVAPAGHPTFTRTTHALLDL
jgi:hypothetical protein